MEAGVLSIDFDFKPAPTIAFNGAATQYDLDDQINIEIDARDWAGTSLDPACTLTHYWYLTVVETSCTLTMSALDVALRGNVGPYTYQASATDLAGTTATSSIGFDVLPSYPSMKWVTNEWVSKAGVASQLTSYLDAAAKAEARGNWRAEASNLESYRKLLTVQTGKAVDPTYGQYLIDWSYWL